MRIPLPFRFIMCMGVCEILYQLPILLSNVVVNMCFAMPFIFITIDGEWE